MRATLPPDAVYAVRPQTWHALFAARGYPPGLAKRDASHASIAAALAGELPVSLARAVHTLAAFTPEAARTDLYAVAGALAYPTTRAPWTDAVSPVDLAAALLAAAAKDDATAELLDAAKILRDRTFRPSATLVYVGDPGADPAVGEPTQYAGRFGAEAAAWCTANGFGRVLPVAARADAGALSYEIRHEGREATVVVVDADGEPRPVLTRPLRSHVLVYDPRTRILSIATDCLEAATPLAAIAGAVLFGQPRHFLDQPAVDLWKLQELGAAALEVPELSLKLRVGAIGGTWRSGKNHAMTPRGTDFFKALARYKIRIEGGRLELVTLRATIASPDGGPPRCDVALSPPHLLTVSEPEAAPLLHQFLGYAKITQPEPRPCDFFILQPWILSLAEWIAQEGEAGFAKLLAMAILKADPGNRAVAPPDHPHAGRCATAYPLRGGKYLAWSPDPTIAPFVVSEESLVAYALSFAKLAAFVAASLGLEGAAAKLDDDGVLFCGQRALGPTYVCISLATRPIRPATVERLREAAGHGHAVIVTPEGRKQRHGLLEIAMPKLAGPWHPLLAQIVRALRLEAHVDTPLYAPKHARVVVHRQSVRAWLDGVHCAALGETHVRLFDFLITNAGQAMNTKDIADYVAKGKGHEDTTRKAIDSLPGAIAKSFKAQGKAPPADVDALITQPRRGHYLLNVVGFVD